MCGGSYYFFCSEGHSPLVCEVFYGGSSWVRGKKRGKKKKLTKICGRSLEWSLWFRIRCGAQISSRMETVLANLRRLFCGRCFRGPNKWDLCGLMM